VCSADTASDCLVRLNPRQDSHKLLCDKLSHARTHLDSRCLGDDREADGALHLVEQFVERQLNHSLSCVRRRNMRHSCLHMPPQACKPQTCQEEARAQEQSSGERPRIGGELDKSWSTTLAKSSRGQPRHLVPFNLRARTKAVGLPTVPSNRKRKRVNAPSRSR
jgi:hypothetical protein